MASANKLQWHALIYVPILLSVVVAQIPYNPTRLLQDGDYIYVFQPSTLSSAQSQLGFIDISAKIDADHLPYTTLYPTLPFLDDTILRPFTPVLDGGGSLIIYTGNCSQDATGGDVWSLTPASANKGSSWVQQDAPLSSSTHKSTVGPYYLSNGISFSSILGGNATTTGVYLFGGMCPELGDASDNWQSAARYSNSMVTLEPSTRGDSAITYEIDVSSSRGPPIPEAGFTMTGLSPTFSNRSDGSQTQQQNFVLIGGHTSTAFINMSQVALFSLPEQGWTFIGVQQPDVMRTDIVSRDITSVDPRSGHTAVLSSDGQHIIVYGGWVGDVNSPAEPRLAILNVADGYGGNGKWQWSVPGDNSDYGPPSGSSLYGHGATMLPGGIMMITGGYSITTSGLKRRRGFPTTNTQPYFFNITSKSWIANYSPPLSTANTVSSKTGPLSSPAQKAGLGVGIGLGLAAVCGLFAFYMWYTRRLQKQRDLREKQLQGLSFAAHRYTTDEYSPGFNGRENHADSIEYLTGQTGSYYFPPGSQGGQGWKSSHSQDAERTGLLLEIPSPTRGLRRSLSGRPAYTVGTVRGPGHIHPIDELEEEEDESENITDETARHEMSECSVDPIASVLGKAPHLDPFCDRQHQSCAKRIVPSSTSSSPMLEDIRDHEPLMTEWPGPSSTPNRHSYTGSAGRISPDKSIPDERTNSSLSESSTRSNLSWTSSHGSVGRNASLRASKHSATAQTNPFRSPEANPTHGRPRRFSDGSKRAAVDLQTQSSTSIHNNSYLDVDSIVIAHSSFSKLQAEGEILLGGNPEHVRPGTSSTSNGSNSYVHGDTEAYSSRAATSTPGTSCALETPRPESRDVRKSWLGSMRRVLRRSASGSQRTRSLTNTASYHEPYTDNPVSPVEALTTDNSRSFSSNLPPRRAASDASFWKSRRGKQDWEEEPESRWARNSGDDWGAPEDIARAEKDRLRQEWRERGNLLINLTSDDESPTPRTPIALKELSVVSADNRPCTPADEGDWDVEAAVERRVVQVMFTVPKSKLRVVNADPDGSSILSLPRESSKEGDNFLNGDQNGSPSRVKDLAGKFEQMSSPKITSPRVTPRASPVPSPSPSVRSMKMRMKPTPAMLSLDQESKAKPLTDPKVDNNITKE